MNATNIYYAATNRGFIKATGEFTPNIRLAYPFTSFDVAELIAKEEIAKGNCRNYYAILQTVVSQDAFGIVDCSDLTSLNNS